MASAWSRFAQVILLFAAASALTPGCGSRTELSQVPVSCEPGELGECGSSVGACRPGIAVCGDDEIFGECIGDVGPTREACNDIDDDCDGETDEDFGVGDACDGPDSDLCTDDVMTCSGCSSGPSELETCNGRDDDCDGLVDADCETGSCRPTLVVTGSTPSSPNCVDFPVERSSRGAIAYPCGGGPVSANLGSVTFMGSVANGDVFLTGTRIIGIDESPDGCVWQTDHLIQGNVSSGTLTYSYSEHFLSGIDCWSPCTEVGTIEIQWTLP